MTTAELKDILPTSWTSSGESAWIGGVCLAQLATRFGTPLYVYDRATIRDSTSHLRAAFARLQTRVSFASKACETIGVLRAFRQDGLDLDVVSLGEIEAALRAGFEPRQLHLHGNAKTKAELERATGLRVHAVVIDNREELHRLVEVAARLQVDVQVMIRLRLDLEAETHPHLQTSGSFSKFGISEGELPAILSEVRTIPALRLVGIHAHLGSQIEDLTVYRRAAETLVRLATELRDTGWPIKEASAGGGWKVAYRPGETYVAAHDVAAAVMPAFDAAPWLRPAVEPGRALVARAGVALYRVSSVKSTPAGRSIAVDGGMGDNPRPALYGANYFAMPASQSRHEGIGPADIVGRYCESGDIVARGVQLPEVCTGDLICVPVAGAYQLSMASSYNLVPQPAVVMVEDGQAKLLTRRATVDDLLAREVTEEHS